MILLQAVVIANVENEESEIESEPEEENDSEAEVSASGSGKRRSSGSGLDSKKDEYDLDEEEQWKIYQEEAKKEFSIETKAKESPLVHCPYFPEVNRSLKQRKVL